ncbi:MAG: M13 family metallopeptidase [Bacteroidales bacterium]|nr:M13 family metallopeptidase [Bacteroidales bacterium]
MNFKNSILLLSAVGMASMLGACGHKATGSVEGIASAIDTTANAKDDFYAYACGGWMQAHPLKPEYSRFGTFDELGEKNREQIRDIVLSINPAQEAFGSNAQKVGDLYALGMDSARLNAEGAAPLKDDLATINAANREDIVKLMATLPGLGTFFGTGVEADLANASMNTMYWGQGGLGLGDRDYYTVDSDRNEAIRAAYRNYLTTLGKLIGYNDEESARMTNNVMAIETRLAKKHLTRTQQRDIPAQYNPRSVAELDQQFPAIGLADYFKAQNLDVDTVIVDNPAYYEEVANALASESLDVLRDYMTASYVSSAANYLSDDFTNAKFELRKVMSGVEEQQPRWKRALAVPNGVLGEALGQLYVAKYFPESSKEKMEALVGNLQTALGQHIENLTWMSDTTKAKALEKLAAFTVKIGYPDQWRDYTNLTIDPKESYWENMKKAIVFNTEFNNADYGKPVDRNRWFMSPQTVNAYYNPTTNEICFPAGILQAPFFDPEADDAVNYGAIGVVIGHEMTHGFDDQGRQFDKDGNMADWWTAADAEAFEELANKLVEQFNKVEVAPGTFANGKLTLGENIADQGGLRVAYTAYHNSLNGSEGEVVGGFTPDQRFYLGYANVWAGNIRDAEILQRTESDPHSLGKWRVNATLRNLEPFYKAFDIAEGDAMFMPTADRVVIW